MSDLISREELYKHMAELETLARNRVLSTESSLPYSNNINPSYIRYSAQLDERTSLKHMIADIPSVQPKTMLCGGCFHVGYADRECRNCCRQKADCYQPKEDGE